MNELSPAEMPPEIIQALINGEESQFRKLIQANVFDFNTFSAPDANGCTILHHACSIEDKVTAEMSIRIIKNALASLTYEVDELSEFVNRKNREGHTALNIAVKRRHYAAIEILLCHNAIVDEATMAKISKHYYHLLLNTFDDGIVLNRDPIDGNNEALWTLDCDFRVLTGPKPSVAIENDRFRESLQLAQILKLDNYKEILAHPLPQLFLLKKRQLYENIIDVSVLLHIIWTILSYSFIMCTANAFTPNKEYDSGADKINSIAQNISELTDFDVCNIFRSDTDEWPTLKIIIFLFWILALFKEVIEMILSVRLSTCFYLKRTENWGHILVIFIAMPIGLFLSPATIENWTNSKTDWLYGVYILYLAVGLTSLFLVQFQLTKVEHLGSLVEITRKMLWKILFLLLTFLPMLLAYLLVFRIVMTDQTQHYINHQVLAMMTGELNHDETLSVENTKYTIIKDEMVAKVMLICFIISVVLLFQKIVISLTISDIEKLKTKATAKKLATTLELLYLLETVLISDFVLFVLNIFGKKNTHVSRYTLCSEIVKEWRCSECENEYRRRCTCTDKNLSEGDTISIKFVDLSSTTQLDVKQRLRNKFRRKRFLQKVLGF